VEQLFRWWDEGRISPVISETYPLERAPEAIEALRDRRAIGKLVVTL
jgi:NADPH2:quinone reductase